LPLLTPATPPATGAAAAAASARMDLQDAGRRPGATRPGRRAGVEGRRRAARVASEVESSSVASMAPPCMRRGDWVVDPIGARMDGGWSRLDDEKAAEWIDWGLCR
jgi:hypothetical protein